MSFVTTQPEALTAAASALQTLGTSMAAQNTAAAAPDHRDRSSRR